MPAPTEFLDWNDSLSNVIDPPSGLKTTGYVPGAVLDAQYFNWIVNLTDQWIKWLSGVTSVIQISVSAAYSVALNVQTVLANPTGGSFAVTLPAASACSVGQRFTVKNIGISSSNTVSLTPTGSDKIENNNFAFSIAQGEYITVETDGVSNFWQVG